MKARAHRPSVVGPNAVQRESMFVVVRSGGCHGFSWGTPSPSKKGNVGNLPIVPSVLCPNTTHCCFSRYDFSVVEASTPNGEHHFFMKVPKVGDTPHLQRVNLVHHRKKLRIHPWAVNCNPVTNIEKGAGWSVPTSFLHHFDRTSHEHSQFTPVHLSNNLFTIPSVTSKKDFNAIVTYQIRVMNWKSRNIQFIFAFQGFAVILDEQIKERILKYESKYGIAICSWSKVIR